MHRLLAVAALTLSLACSSCAHVPPPIKDFGQCVTEDLGGQVAAVITEVETDLASGSFVALLTDLGKRVGFAVVDCAVSEVTTKARAQAASAPNAELAK